ncbi:MAG: alanine racemase [Chitinispirillales bacterium]|jgi:alanine racemase|nr:alanine racemase [Chitinispirillales bacterium]
MDDNRAPYSPYVEISLDNILHNLAQIRSVLPRGAGVMAVVKDSSYGCGSVEIAKALERDGGVEIFAVARPCEAFALKKSGIASPVLVLGFATDGELRFGADKNVIFALNDLSDTERWRSCGADIRFHLNIDTGMSRLGVLSSEINLLIDAIKAAPNISIDGVFTHMASADESGTQTVDHQLKKFTKCVGQLREAGLPPVHIHYGNSAAFLRFPVDGCTLVRPGIALYGCKPDPAQDFDINLKPAASLISSVVKMKKVPAGTAVSYGGNYITTEETWIATIALGYAHGLPRFLTGKGGVIINGKPYRIAGNVTMDYIMVDAGPNPAISIGDKAVAIGSCGGETITPDDIAVMGNTIGYEILCNLGTSIDRFYMRGGKIICHDPGVVF